MKYMKIKRITFPIFHIMTIRSMDSNPASKHIGFLLGKCWDKKKILGICWANNGPILCVSWE